MIDLILGGARSGKSRLAEQLAASSGRDVIYVATAQSKDSEMAQRVHDHQRRRPNHWQTVEEPIALTAVLKQFDQPNQLVLVDCLTLWISNILCSEDPNQFEPMKSDLLRQLEQQQSDLIIVSNETGSGVVPMGELSRRFVDESGTLHQDLAYLAHRVTLVVAGLPLYLKQP